ncbi:putative FAD-containing monooxygenase MymA [Nocardioides baekrokdamisoli]|uniref:Putative FAD-containing monooxygenase MymA n=1 Tax=Nocardioides baekrokdamisoli TaxID=1804624 RepID=A0A3G9J5E5_9ACTN|nr:NAD(P)/FAD-dependent oxidoreductase [Nocardioides baekrokdamisoli]BBH18554.1 putative FAD-containing monooxygenase MymA [Nocardioides baekrokdamisoli]
MTTQHAEVLIIGAGISGIGIASRLRREFPERDIAILERRRNIGGTWDLFRYPGIRSDSDMFTFGYEFKPWDETKVLADGPAIRNYVTTTARENGVDQLIHHGLKVIDSDWSSADQRWTVTALREETGDIETWTCTYLVIATGYYNYDAGHTPEFAGIEDFAGSVIHPQHWPEDFDHTGKKVVVIGSGATAVTLVPSMADTVEHITMLQRSPSYILPVPSVDKITAAQRRFLPRAVSHRMTRTRNIAMWRAMYGGSRKYPKQVRAMIAAITRRQLGEDFDMSHFTPKYDPWDQRLCAVPDGDLFKALRSGKASIVTDRIERFTENGILLTSGRELEADVIITATGLELQMLGGATLRVDGKVHDIADGCVYKGVMLQDVPNLLWVLGYTNISWTLKVDIAGAWLVRLLQHMDATGHAVAVPVDRSGLGTAGAAIDEMSSGYIQRGLGMVPRQGKDFPWRLVMDYKHDRQVLLNDPIEDGVLSLQPVRQPVAQAVHP